jgi:RecA/RadA recombinase
MAVSKKRISARKKIESTEHVKLSDTYEIDSVLKEIQKSCSGLIVPEDDSDEALIAVKDWIELPEPIRKPIGAKGLPCPSVVVAQGKPDSGKTTFSITCMVNAQKEGASVILLDSEDKFNWKRAKVMGLDVKKTGYFPATTIESVFDVTAKMVDVFKKHNKKALIIWDSIGATPTKKGLAEFESGDPKELAMKRATIIREGLRSLVQVMRGTKIAFVAINHVGANMNMFGKKTTASGGSGPTYHASLILEFTRIGGAWPKKKEKGSSAAGSRVMLEVTKNHLAQPFQKNEIEVDWKGIVYDRDVEYAPEGFFDSKLD